MEHEGTLRLAIRALRNGKIPSSRRAAELYKVPRSPHRDRLSGHRFQPEHRNARHRLSKTQEIASAEWIISQDTQGAAPGQSQVKEMPRTEELLRNTGLKLNR